MHVLTRKLLRNTEYFAQALLDGRTGAPDQVTHAVVELHVVDNEEKATER